MRRFLISIFVVAFLFSAIAIAGNQGCSEAARKACTASKTKAACDAHKTSEASVQIASSEKADETAEADHVCPDVGGRTALQGFHECMHPLHMALSNDDYDAIREGMPSLLKASKAVEKYECKGYDKGSKEFRETFDSRKKELLNAVNDLKKACKGKDNEKVTASFDKMHEAYIAFANTDSH